MADRDRTGQNQIIGSIGATPELARESFFSELTPDADLVRYTAQLGEEYLGKHVLDMLLLHLPRPDLITAPLLVLGAENDGCSRSGKSARPRGRITSKRKSSPKWATT